jgi:hypothetical protein
MSPEQAGREEAGVDDSVQSARKPRNGKDGESGESHGQTMAETSERLHAIERMVAGRIDEPPPEVKEPALPVQAESLYPITDIWHIAPSLDCLRAHIAQFAREIAHEASLDTQIAARDDGIGFVCLPQPEPIPDFARAVLALLQFLNDSPALIGQPGSPARRLSDEGTIKIFRLTRLARRLRDIEADAAADPPES